MADSIKLSICPYNNSHKIATFKMSGHLLKCRKNYRGPPLVRCVYNASHLVQPCDMQTHLETCRDRHLFHGCDYERSFRENAHV